MSFSLSTAHTVRPALRALWLARRDQLLSRGFGWCLVLLAAPILLARALVALASTGRLLASQEVWNEKGTRSHVHSFSGPAPGRRLALLLDIAAGRVRFVGPRPLSTTQQPAVDDVLRLTAKPGVVCPLESRRALGLRFESDREVLSSFLRDSSVRGRLTLVLARLLGAIASRDAQSGAPLHMLGVRIDDCFMDEAVQWFCDRAQSGRGARVSFVNPDCLNKAVELPDYCAAVNSCDLVLADGIGLRLGAALLGSSLSDNVNGTDLFPQLCERAEREGLRLFLLGGRPGIARAAADRMVERYPGLQVVGCRNGYFDDDEPVLEEILEARPHILLVAFGAPLQELWLQKHAAQLSHVVCAGVGGLFDFYSGRIQRAPRSWRLLGLEWVWRLRQEPKRMWRRYVVGNPLFLARVAHQRLAESFGVTP